MFGGVVNKLKSLDVYRKIPKDYTESTISGAMSISPFLVFIFTSFVNQCCSDAFTLCEWVEQLSECEHHVRDVYWC